MSSNSIWPLSPTCAGPPDGFESCSPRKRSGSLRSPRGSSRSAVFSRFDRHVLRDAVQRELAGCLHRDLLQVRRGRGQLDRLCELERRRRELRRLHDAARNWPSRWPESLVSVVMSTVNLASLTVVPTMVTLPVTASVLPVAVLFYRPRTTSATRYWTLLPLVGSTNLFDRRPGSLAAPEEYSRKRERWRRIGRDEVDVHERPADHEHDESNRDTDDGQSHRRLAHCTTDIAPSWRAELRICWQIAGR